MVRFKVILVLSSFETLSNSVAYFSEYPSLSRARKSCRYVRNTIFVSHLFVSLSYFAEQFLFVSQKGIHCCT